MNNKNVTIITISLLFLVFNIIDKNEVLFNYVFAHTQIAPENLEEIQDNLIEVRLALQKGDLIEALQHLNNAEEELMLISTEMSISNKNNN